MVKVSVLMPAYNVEKYITECMDSVLAQTLRDIEIVCIDDGSKDKTGSMLDEYAARDSRVRVIHKENTGYGHSMNTALSYASGEYIGIVETDDFIEPNMFEVMYRTAKENDADVVKTNYYDYYAKRKNKNRPVNNLGAVGLYNERFAPKDNQKIFLVTPSIWSGIYRREMIETNHIRFTETPGASYQDTSFAFKVWACAKTVYLIEDRFLHYRRDNESSSVNSPKKIYCVCDEYDEIDRFIADNKKSQFIDIKNAMQFSSYRWNYYRLSLEYRYVFLQKIIETFSPLYEKKNLNKESFKPKRWIELEAILADPDEYFLQSCKKELGEKSNVSELVQENKLLRSQIKKIEASTSYRVGRSITALPRKFKKMMKK